MRTDMEFMNRVFHAALRRDLERAIGALTAARHPTPAERAALAEHVDLVLDLLHHHHTGEDTVCGLSSGAAPPTSAPNWT